MDASGNLESVGALKLTGGPLTVETSVTGAKGFIHLDDTALPSVEIISTIEHLALNPSVARFGTSTDHFFQIVADGNPVITVDPGNKVGINTTTPRCALDVDGGTSITPPSGVWGSYMNTYEVTTLGDPYNLWARQISIIASHGIASTQFSTYSDTRIKKNIEDIQQCCGSAEVKRMLSALSPKFYNRKDYVENGHGRYLGFIAHEVEDVVPSAVNVLNMEQFIPDIYVRAHYDESRGSIYFETEQDLTNGRIKVILPNLDEKIYEFETISQLEIRLLGSDVKPTNGSVFVYGTAVHDFKTVDYQQLFSLGMVGIKELISDNENIRKDFDDINAKYDALLSRIIALEGSSQFNGA